MASTSNPRDRIASACCPVPAPTSRIRAPAGKRAAMTSVSAARIWLRNSIVNTGSTLSERQCGAMPQLLRPAALLDRKPRRQEDDQVDREAARDHRPDAERDGPDEGAYQRFHDERGRGGHQRFPERGAERRNLL